MAALPVETDDGTYTYPCPECPLLFEADTYEDVLEATADHLLEEHE